jgi:hypothetical protein
MMRITQFIDSLNHFIINYYKDRTSKQVPKLLKNGNSLQSSELNLQLEFIIDHVPKHRQSLLNYSKEIAVNTQAAIEKNTLLSEKQRTELKSDIVRFLLAMKTLMTKSKSELHTYNGHELKGLRLLTGFCRSAELFNETVFSDVNELSYNSSDELIKRFVDTMINEYQLPLMQREMEQYRSNGSETLDKFKETQVELIKQVSLNLKALQQMSTELEVLKKESSELKLAKSSLEEKVSDLEKVVSNQNDTIEEQGDIIKKLVDGDEQISKHIVQRAVDLSHSDAKKQVNDAKLDIARKVRTQFNQLQYESDEEYDTPNEQEGWGSAFFGR